MRCKVFGCWESVMYIDHFVCKHALACLFSHVISIYCNVKATLYSFFSRGLTKLPHYLKHQE